MNMHTCAETTTSEPTRARTATAQASGITGTAGTAGKVRWSVAGKPTASATLTAITVAATLTMVLAGTAYADVVGDIKARGAVIMGVRADAEPLSYLPAGAQVAEGLAPDLCRAVVADMERRKILPPGIAIKYVPVTNAERFKAIAERRIDMECADTTNNRERRDKLGMAFTIPHYYAGVRLLVPKKSKAVKIEDLRGKTVLITKGTTSGKLLDERSAAASLNIKALECATPSDCFNDLMAGKGDAYMMDDIQLFSLRARAPNPGEWEVIGKLLSIEPLAIMLPNGDDLWKAQFDQSLREMIREHRFHTLYTKWLESPIPPKQVNYNIPMNYFLKDSLKYPTDRVAD